MILAEGVLKLHEREFRVGLGVLDDALVYVLVDIPSYHISSKTYAADIANILLLISVDEFLPRGIRVHVVQVEAGDQRVQTVGVAVRLRVSL